jgi:hypothetical protein
VSADPPSTVPDEHERARLRSLEDAREDELRADRARLVRQLRRARDAADRAARDLEDLDCTDDPGTIVQRVAGSWGGILEASAILSARSTRPRHP